MKKILKTFIKNDNNKKKTKHIKMIQNVQTLHHTLCQNKNTHSSQRVKRNTCEPLTENSCLRRNIIHGERIQKFERTNTKKKPGRVLLNSEARSKQIEKPRPSKKRKKSYGKTTSTAPTT